MQSEILKTAKSARKAKGDKVVEIVWGLPTVAINLSDKEYFFQGQEASDLLAEAVDSGNKFEAPVEDVLIWMSQSW